MRARFWWPLAVAVSVMVWLVPATARAQATRTVTGMVVDGAGDGVVGATVVLDGDPAVTTQSVDGGGFVLAKVPAMRAVPARPAIPTARVVRSPSPRSSSRAAVSSTSSAVGSKCTSTSIARGAGGS